MRAGNPPKIARLKLSDAHPRRILFLTVRTASGASAPGAFDRYYRFDSARVSKWVWVGHGDEERPHKHEIERVGPYSCRDRSTIVDPEELLDWIEKGTNSRLDTWIVSHNCAFDLQLCGGLDAIKTGRWRFDSRVRATPDDPDSETFAESSPGLQILNDPPTILSLRVLLIHRLIALDSRNYWDVSISELAEGLGLTIPPVPAADALDRTLSEYLDARLRPVELSILNLVRWLDDKGFGRLRFSAAGVAMQAYRTAHIPAEIHPTIDEDVRKAERTMSYAGEVRTWRIGRIDGPIHQLDVSSLYASVMRGAKFPVRAIGKVFDGRWRVSFPADGLDSAAAEVFVRDFGEAWPIKDATGTRFVRGTFITWLCGPELAEAVEKGVVLGWRSVITYEMAELFTSWVDDLWRERLDARAKGDRVRESFAKTLLNSLWGKFGQRGGDLVQRTDFLAGEDWGRWLSISATTGKRRSFQCMNGVPFEEVPKKEIARSFPAISAWVTAFGRRRMRFLRQVAGFDNVFYQGVDGLLVSTEGKERLQQGGEIAEKELGKLRELGEAPHCTIRGWGDYEIGSKRVVQGIKSEATQLLERQFEFPVLNGLRHHLFFPGPRVVAESRRIVTLPEESVIGTKDSNGRVWAPVRREPIPEELRLALQSIGRRVDFDRQQLDDSSEIPFVV